jgi:hypothetical protein
MSTARYYLSFTRQKTIPYYDRLFPDWKEKTIIMVKFNSPQRILSFDEFIEMYSEIPEERRQFEYDMLQCHPVAYYPEDDLELLEAANVNV